MESIPTSVIKSKHLATLLGALILVAIVTIVPQAFAQESNPIGYTDVDAPHGSIASMGWVAGMAVAGAMSGVGVWTAIRRH